ncbi:MAG: VWA domain-containing protein [Planctomycetes bacterium]|nr:VWA domain-containing protein [Planctomycetota bacterium]
MNTFAHFAIFLQDAPAPVKSAAEQRLHVFGDYALADPWFLLAIPLGILLLSFGRSAHGRDKGRVPVLPDAAHATVARHWTAAMRLPAFLALLTALLARYTVLPALTAGAGGAAASASSAVQGSAPALLNVLVVVSALLLVAAIAAPFVLRAPASTAPRTPHAGFPRSWAQRLGFVVPALQLAALVCVSIALSRPLRGSIETTSTTEGIDIALVIDRSGSMAYEDLAPGTSRLAVVKEVVEAFAARRMTDREGAADNCALITFAAYPQLLCPFTLDVDAITGFLRGLEPVKERSEDGTGIGIGLSKAVLVLKETQSRSKVVVLLTDGENNIDLIPPADAARLAAEQGIRVYTVFAGRFVYQPDFFGNLHATEREIDTSDLENIASTTGGLFFRARDKQELERVYAEIERLERTPRIEQQWSDTFDLYPWFLAPALAAYALAWLLASTLFRRIA